MNPNSRRAAAVVAAAIAWIVALATVALPAQAWTAGQPPPRISYIADVNGVSEVWTMTQSGADKKQVTFRDPAGLRPGHGATKKCDPAISPDGKEVAYAANDGGFYVVPASGESDATPPVRISPPAPSDPGQQEGGRRPTWSPDGTTVMFHLTKGSMRSTAPYEQVAVNLWMAQRPIKADGTFGAFAPAAQVTDFQAGEWAMHPRFSPDGQSVAYTYRPTTTGTYTLHVMAKPTPSAAGTPAPALPVDPPGQSLGANSAGATFPSWAPSGKQIAFLKACDGGLQTASITRSTSGAWSLGAPTRVTQGAICGGATWSSHSESLIVYSDGSRVYVLDRARKGKNTTAVGSGSQPGW